MIKPTTPLPLVVLLSGRGSNFSALLEATRSGGLPVDIRGVISNRPNAPGLTTAAKAGIPTRVLDHTGFAGREQYDQALIQCIDAFAPSLVVLAGFMRILTPAFVRHYQCRLVNIHPSLLPRHRGLHTHARALAEGDRKHGASVHFVTEELDGGPVFLQAKVSILPEDTETSLAQRVLSREHRLYPEAIRLIATGRIHCDDDKVFLDGKPLSEPLILDDDR